MNYQYASRSGNLETFLLFLKFLCFAYLNNLLSEAQLLSHKPRKQNAWGWSSIFTHNWYFDLNIAFVSCFDWDFWGAIVTQFL